MRRGPHAPHCARAPGWSVAVTPEVVIFVCTTCKREGDAPDGPRAGAVLAEAVASGAPVRVQPVKCLSNCKRGPSAAIVRPGGWSYVFGHLELEGTPEALHQGAALLGASEDGTMPWQGRPDILKRNMIARIPPFDFAPLENAS
jgi:predicted metal-binding protein